jgi:hypothetical protein
MRSSVIIEVHPLSLLLSLLAQSFQIDFAKHISALSFLKKSSITAFYFGVWTTVLVWGIPKRVYF